MTDESYHPYHERIDVLYMEGKTEQVEKVLRSGKCSAKELAAAFIWAIDAEKDVNMARRFLNAGAEIKDFPEKDSTSCCLSIAIDYKHYDLVKELLERGANPNLRDSEEANSCLDHAFEVRKETNDDSYIKLLVKHGAKVDELHPWIMQTRLESAIHDRDEKETIFLLRMGADPNVHHPYAQYLPIMRPIWRKDTKLVGILLGYGADPSGVNPKSGKTIIDEVFSKENSPTPEMLDLFFENGATAETVDPKKINALLETALAASDLKMVKSLMNYGVDITSATDGKPILLTLSEKMEEYKNKELKTIFNQIKTSAAELIKKKKEIYKMYIHVRDTPELSFDEKKELLASMNETANKYLAPVKVNLEREFTKDYPDIIATLEKATAPTKISPHEMLFTKARE